MTAAQAIRNLGWWGGMASYLAVWGEYESLPGRYWWEKELWFDAGSSIGFAYRTTCHVELSNRNRTSGWHWYSYLLVNGSRSIDASGESETMLEAIELLDVCLDRKTMVAAIRAFMRQRRTTLSDAATGEELFGVFNLAPSTPVPCGRYHYLRHLDGQVGKFDLRPQSCSTGPLRELESTT